MHDYKKLSKIFFWILSSLLAIVLFLGPIIFGGTSDALYAKGYANNGVYERIPPQEVWNITENVQGFLVSDNALLFFPSDQAAHLKEVKDVYTFGRVIFFLGIMALGPLFGLFVRFSFQARFGKYTAKTRAENEKIVFNFKDTKVRNFYAKSFSSLFKNTGFIMFALLLILALLASSWDAFFTKFHELFFSGQWQFETSTLMIQLWDHPFFFVAAKFIALRIVFIVFALLVFSYVLQSVQRKVVW